MSPATRSGACATLPARLVVLGGGPIGCELAQSFARLGSAVTQVEMLPRIMIREDEDVSAFAQQRLRARWRDACSPATRRSVARRTASASSSCSNMPGPGAAHRVRFAAVRGGRSARLKGFGLEELGIAGAAHGADQRVPADDLSQHLAAGDVAGPYQFTHTASHQAWYAAVNGLFGMFRRFKADYSVIPWTTFIDPEVARVGLNEQEAEEKGVRLRGHALRASTTSTGPSPTAPPKAGSRC